MNDSQVNDPTRLVLYHCDHGHDFLVVLPEVRDCRCGGHAHQVVDVSTGDGGTGSAGGEYDDQAATRRPLWDMRQRLENLQADLISLYRALNGLAGAIGALAAELLDDGKAPVPGPGQHEAGACGGPPTCSGRSDRLTVRLPETPAWYQRVL